MACVYCKSEKGLLEHHQSYNPERTVIVCNSCHCRIHQQISGWIKRGKREALCKTCVRHFTSNQDEICYKCKHCQSDWFGLSPSDKTPPIIMEGYSI